MDWVLRVDEVSLVQLDNKVLAEGAIQFRVINDDLVVARLAERGE